MLIYMYIYTYNLQNSNEQNLVYTFYYWTGIIRKIKQQKYKKIVLLLLLLLLIFCVLIAYFETIHVFFYVVFIILWI